MAEWVGKDDRGTERYHGACASSVRFGAEMDACADAARGAGWIPHPRARREHLPATSKAMERERLRQDVARGLEFAGLRLDSEANAGGAADRAISASGSAVAALVIVARDLMVLEHVVRLLEGAS